MPQTMEIFQFLDRTNWKDLRKQKQTLVDVQGGDTITPEQYELLEGLLGLIDAFQDMAADNYGKPAFANADEGQQMR